MAKPKTATGSHLLILVGDGATPTEAFAAPCGLTSKGINFSASSNEDNIPDCDDPDAPSWTDRTIQALSAGVTASGLLALESWDTWREWFLSGEARNCRVKLDVAAADNGGYFQGRFLLTTFNVNGDIGRKVRLDSVALQSDGEVTWVDAT